MLFFSNVILKIVLLETTVLLESNFQAIKIFNMSYLKMQNLSVVSLKKGMRSLKKY